MRSFGLHQILLVVAILLLSTKAFAQDFMWQTGELIFGATVGANYSSLDIPGEGKANARPFAGWEATKVLSPQFGFKANSFFSFKASQINSGANYQQLGLDLQVFPQYKWDDLYLNAGLGFDFPINQGIQYMGNAASERTRVRPEDYEAIPAHFNFLLGFEIKVAPNWKLSSNYMYPIGSVGNQNFQLGVNYRISRRYASPESQRKIRKRITARQIQQLKEGTLLVRLKTSQPKIDALKSKGFENEAIKVEEEQRRENLSLIKAFKTTYNFSEVRFFMSYNSNKVREKNFTGIFLDDTLGVDSNIVIRNLDKIFTAEFAYLDEDTAKYFSHYRWEQTGPFAQKPVPVYYGGSGISFMAFVVKDEMFNQLDKPFPFYSRALFKAIQENQKNKFFYYPVMLFSPMSYGECIENLNQKLHKFSRKVELRTRPIKP